MKIWWHIFNYCIEALLHVKQEPLINVSFESNYSLNVKARCGVSESIRTKIYSLDDVLPIKSLTRGFIVVRNIITTFTNKRKNIL